MTSIPQIFRYQDNDIRTVLIEGEPWWIATDVCTALDIKNVSDAVSRLDEDEKITIGITDGNRGNPNRLCVSEPGLWGLVMISQKPEAKEFKRWLKHDVIPSIRKTGSYSANQSSNRHETLPFNKSTIARCRANEELLPAGFWCCANEMYKEAMSVKGLDAELIDAALPDGSCGKKWRKHCEKINHPLLKLSKKVQLWCPNIKITQAVWVYPYAMIEDFRVWLREEYSEYYQVKYLPARSRSIVASCG